MIVVVIAGTLALIAIALSVRHIKQHLTYYKMPEFQLHIVRILAMVPIYSVTSSLALFTKDERNNLILELIRDSYEAYVVYNFVVLLINYGGGHLHLCRYLEDQPRMEHPFPGKLWLPPLKLGPAFMAGIRVAVLQFVFVKPINSCLKLYLFHRDRDSNVYAVLLVAILILNNLSVSAALYGLVLFYHAADALLRPYQPLAKFLCVKAVVFFSFWQGVVISAAIGLGLIHDVPGFSAHEQATGLQDVLICFEMAIAAISHMYVFSYTEYDNSGDDDVVRHIHDPSLLDVSEKGEQSSAAKHPLLDVVDFRDVLSDAKDRFYGGVGFERELNDGAPIVPGNVLGDSVPSSASTSFTYNQQTLAAQRDLDMCRPKWLRDASATTNNLLTSPSISPSESMAEPAAAGSVSHDLMSTPWLLQAPTTPPFNMRRYNNNSNNNNAQE